MPHPLRYSHLTSESPVAGAKTHGGPLRLLERGVRASSLLHLAVRVLTEIAQSYCTRLVPSCRPTASKCPRQESNLVLDLRRVACEIRHTPRTYLVARRGIEPRLADPKSAVPSVTLAGRLCPVARPGVEPGPTASEADMLSGTPTGQFQGVPTWSRTRTKTLGGSCAIHYTIGTSHSYYVTMQGT